MDDTLAPASPATGGSGDTPAKERFAKAIEEAKAGVGALGKEAQDRASSYGEKLTSQGGEWTNQAKDRATGFAADGKAKASEAIASLGKLVTDNAGLIDDKVGAKYGDYVRSAGQSLQSVSERLDAKSLDELTEDAREFVRTSPGLAVGLAAVGGYMIARLLRGSSD